MQEKLLEIKPLKGNQHIFQSSVNASGVIGIIFAMSVMHISKTYSTALATFCNFISSLIGSPWSIFERNSWKYALVYFVLIVFFTWFYTQVTFKPDEMAENMHKSSGFIPGIRPGEHTANYIDKVLT